MTSIRFDHPELLALLLLGVPIVWLAAHSLAALEPVRRWTAVVLRLVVLLLLVFMLAGMQGVKQHTDLSIIVVHDTSESVRRFARAPDGGSMEQWINDWIGRASSDKRQTDRLGVVTYDARAVVRVMPSEAGDPDIGTAASPRDGTNSAAALRVAMAILPADTAGRLVLISDFNDTLEGLEAAALEARAAGIVVDVLPIKYKLDHEVLIEALYAPTDAREGQTAGLRVVLRATHPADGTLHLFHDDESVGRGYRIHKKEWTRKQNTDDSLKNTPPQEKTSEDGGYMLVKQIDLPLVFSGVNRFRAVFETDTQTGGDTVSVNNRADAFTLVVGEGRVLMVNYFPQAQDSGLILPQALQSRGINVDIIDPAEIPARMTQLQRYDAIIFQNVPADRVTGPQQRMIAKYVNDMGGGFVMIGGPESFAAGGWTHSPIDRILPVACQIPSQTILPSGALVIVIDRSGSMSSHVAGTTRSQQDLANEAAVLAMSTLYPDDLVGVVVFDTEAKWIVKVQANRDPPAMAALVRSVQPDGGTNIYSGLEEAYKALAPMRTSDAAIRHIILLTDGDSTPPPGGSYIGLVAKMMKADITLSTIGIGDGHNGTLLNQLAQMGGGTYHPIANLALLPQIFIKEAKTIRKNLIKETTFTPQLRTTGSPIMTHIQAVPDLKGLVLTGPKHDPRVFMPIIGPEGEPVFAHWQVGLGRSAAFTSDATNRWATDWLNWSGYSDFWARTIRTIARPTQSRSVDLITDIKNNTLNIRLDTAGDEAAASFAKIVGSVLQPEGSAVAIKLEQTGPGLYEANLPATQSGNYIVSLFLTAADGSRQAVFGGASRPPGLELRQFQSNLPLAQRVAQITGGKMLNINDAATANLFVRDHDFVTRSIRPIWRSLLGVLLVMILLDVACRRIAWDLAAIRAWCGEYARAIFGSRQVEAESTLGALKVRRDRDRASASATDSTRKFEANPTFVARDNVTDAVGGASNEPSSSVTIQKETTDAPEDAGSTTHRLIKARQMKHKP